MVVPLGAELGVSGVTMVECEAAQSGPRIKFI